MENPSTSTDSHTTRRSVPAELGEGADTAHSEVGEFVAQQGIDVVLSVGVEDASAISTSAAEAGLSGGAHHFQTASECAGYLAGEATPDDLILIKGSRSSQMEAVIEHLSSPS